MAFAELVGEFVTEALSMDAATLIVAVGVVAAVFYLAKKSEKPAEKK